MRSTGFIALTTIFFALSLGHVFAGDVPAPLRPMMPSGAYYTTQIGTMTITSGPNRTRIIENRVGEITFGQVRSGSSSEWRYMTRKNGVYTRFQWR